MKKNRINPKRVNFFNYKFDGVTIIFKKIGEKMNGISKFTFEVTGDLELTKKLNKSVKATKVQWKGIPFTAEALFQIICQGEFKELILHDELVDMKYEFHERFSRYLEFRILNISNELPKFRAEIAHPTSGVDYYGEGRTKDEAKAQALRQLLGA